MWCERVTDSVSLPLISGWTVPLTHNFWSDDLVWPPLLVLLEVLTVGGAASSLVLHCFLMLLLTPSLQEHQKSYTSWNDGDTDKTAYMTTDTSDIGNMQFCTYRYSPQEVLQAKFTKICVSVYCGSLLIVENKYGHRNQYFLDHLTLMLLQNNRDYTIMKPSLPYLLYIYLFSYHLVVK